MMMLFRIGPWQSRKIFNLPVSDLAGLVSSPYRAMSMSITSPCKNVVPQQDSMPRFQRFSCGGEVLDRLRVFQVDSAVHGSLTSRLKIRRVVVGLLSAVLVDTCDDAVVSLEGFKSQLLLRLNSLLPHLLDLVRKHYLRFGRRIDTVRLDADQHATPDLQE